MYRIKDSVMNKHTLNADKKFLLHMSTPSLIQVICKNIEPNLSSNGHNFIIETIPMTLKSKILDYQPKIKKYFRINTNELKSIQVELLDENDELIKFKVGFPTIVKLKISNMSIEKDSFYIRVSCKDSKSVFPLNTCSSFQARLPKELRLGVNWRASLTSIYLPKNIHNIYELMNTITIDKYHDSDMTKDEESFKVSIEPGYYNSPYSLCTSINSALAPTPLKIKFHEKTKRLYFTGDDRKK